MCISPVDELAIPKLPHAVTQTAYNVEIISTYKLS